MTVFKVLIHAPWHDQGCILEENIFKQEGLEVECQDHRDLNEFIRLAPAADAVIIEPMTPMNREMIQRFGRSCRLIITHSIGFDHIDLEAAREKGIVIANVPDFCLEEVSDHTLALMLSAGRNVARYDREVRSGIWKEIGAPAPRQFRQCVLGVAGFGRLGRLVAAKAKWIFKEVIAYDPYMNAKVAADMSVRVMDSLEALISESDIVTLHMPGNPSGQPVINSARLALFKPTAILVNAARGNLVDEQGLYEALSSGRLWALATDVLVREPPVGAQPILTLPNVTITPHAGWYSNQADDTVRINAAKEVCRALRGEKLVNQVN